MFETVDERRLDSGIIEERKMPDRKYYVEAKESYHRMKQNPTKRKKKINMLQAIRNPRRY
tara:strand:- start:210 stop:389 length:180 start_codon:yes stop_codon:yes gene_type:complete